MLQRLSARAKDLTGDRPGVRRLAHPETRQMAHPEPPTSAATARSWAGWPLLILIAITALLWLPRLAGPIDLRYDAGAYYILGTSLAQGKGYRLTNEPGEIHAVQYPPLLPSIIALQETLLGQHDPVVVGHYLRLLNLAFSLAYTIAVYLFTRRYLPAWWALFAALITIASLQTYYLSDLLFAELPFALVSILFFLASSRASGRTSQLLAGLLAAAAFLLRTTGVALLAAWILEGAFAGGLRRAAYRSVFLILPLVLWQAYVTSIQSSPEYQQPSYPYQRAAYQYYNVNYLDNILLIDPFRPELGKASPRDILRRAFGNVLPLAVGLGETISAPIGFPRLLITRVNERLPGIRVPYRTAQIVLLALAVFIIVGLIQLARRRELLLPAYVVVSLTLIDFTPWPGQFTRYLMPLAPVLSVALCLGLMTTLMVASRRTRLLAQRSYLVPLPAVGVVLILEAFSVHDAYIDHHDPVVSYDAADQPVAYHLFYYDENWDAFERALYWLKGHDVGTDSVIATSAPHFAYLRTGHRAVMPPFEPDTSAAQTLLDSVPVQYVIVDELGFTDISRRYALPVMEAHPADWLEIYADGARLRIYQRVNVTSDRTGQAERPDRSAAAVVR